MYFYQYIQKENNENFKKYDEYYLYTIYYRIPGKYVRID